MAEAMAARSVRRLAGALLLMVACSAVVLAEAGKPSTKQSGAAKLSATRNFRLPGDVTPSNYTLRIVTHFQDDNFRFYGQALIDIDVVRETSVLRLHAKQLQVDQRTVTVTLLGEDDEDSNSIPELPQEEEEGQKEDKPGVQGEEPKPIDQAEGQMQEIKPEGKPEEQKPVEQRPEQQIPAVQKPEDPAEPKPQALEQKPEEQKPTEPTPEAQEQKPEEQNPAETKPEAPEQLLEKQKPSETQPEAPEQTLEEQKPLEQKPEEQKLEQAPEEQTTEIVHPVEEQKPAVQKPDEQKQEQKPDEQKQDPKPDEQKHVSDVQPELDKTKQETASEMQSEMKPEMQTDEQKQVMEPSAQEQKLEELKPTLQPSIDLKLEEEITDKKQDAVQKQDDKVTDEAVKNGDKLQPEEEKGEETKAGGTRRRRRRQGHYQHRPRDAEFQGLRISNVSMDALLQQLVINLSEPLRSGRRYRIAIRYWGTLNSEDRGYFRGAYLVDGRPRYVASTVFEPAEARRAFPCFDEPLMKANFSLILGRHKNYSTSANMPLDRTESMEEKPDWYWDYYPSTPKMPTYLVAFMVHDLEGTSLNSGAPGTKFRAWTVPGRSQQANFSLSVAPKIMSTLGAQLGVPGVLPKHDMVAVPGFRSEALENWGLISFEEHHLLLPANAGQLNKQSVSTVVAHELAHVWFGNMITPAWWSDIWLSEGFATFYSAEALQQVFPAWRFHETAAGNAYLLVTHTDAMPTTMPVIHPADNPNKLESVFGAISYYKGYWLLRMLESALGADVFDNGVRRYVRRHVFSSVRTQDLWTALQEAVDEREMLDLEAAASASASTGDAIVVGDDSDEDLVRVVVPDSNATQTPVVSSRSRRDAAQAMKAPITQLVLGAADLADKDSGESSGEEQPVSVEAAEKSAPAAPVNVKKVPGPDEVLSPPRRGPGATGFTGKVGWLPRPVDDVMNNWVTQPGHPIVSVFRNPETGVVTLNQRRYMYPAPPGGFPCNASSAWWIPVRWATGPRGSGATGSLETSKSVFWMPPTCANVTLPVKVARDDLLILNAGLSGLYRVRYDSSHLQQLARMSRAAWRQVAPLTRLQLVADALDLARAGRAPYQHALRMVDHLGRDHNPMVWRAALPHLMQLQRQLRARRDGVVLRSWLQDLVSPHANNIGFTTRAQDTPLQASLRYKVTTLACLADHTACQRKAKKSLKQFMAGDKDAIPVGRLTNTQLCAAVRWGSPAEWRFLRAQLSAIQTSALPKKALASALGCSRDQETLRSLLADTLDTNSTLRRGEVSAVLGAVAANELGTDIVLRFLEEKAPQVYKRLGGHPRVEKAFREIAETLNTKRQLDRLDAVLRQFQSQTPTRSPPVWGRDLVRENIRWAERSRGEVSRWLRARADSDDDLELRRTQSKTKTKGTSAATSAGTAPTRTPQKVNTKAPRQLGRTEQVDERDTEDTNGHGIFNHLLNTIFLNSQI